MKLKESTFAIIAEKKDSISHKWFLENVGLSIEWHIGRYYKYMITCWDVNEKRPKDIPIYTESKFEALLKAEQENEAKGGYVIDKPIEFTLNNPKQVTFTYQTAIDLLAYYTKIDKGIIKIEMP